MAFRALCSVPHSLVSLICPLIPTNHNSSCPLSSPSPFMPFLYRQCPSLLLRLPVSHLSFWGQLTHATMTQVFLHDPALSSLASTAPLLPALLAPGITPHRGTQSPSAPPIGPQMPT